VEGGPPERPRGAIPAVSLGRKAVERTSVFVRTLHPSRGVAGPETSAEARSAFARDESPGVSTKAGGDPPFSALLARQGGVRLGSRRGLARRKTARTFTRVSPVRAREPLRRRALRDSSARAIPARGRPKAKAGGRSSPRTAVRGTMRSRSVPVHRRVAEVGRASSCPEKRVAGIEGVESPRGIRSARTGDQPQAERERVSASAGSW